MPLTALLTAHPAPLVALDGTSIAVGQPFTLTASAGDRSWTVAEGTTTGSRMTWADGSAPLGVEVTYTLRVGASTSTATATRPPRPGLLLVCRPDGRGQVLARDLDIADPRGRDVRSRGFVVAGRAGEVSSWDPSAGLPTGELRVDVEEAQLARAEGTLARRGPVLLLTGAPVPGVAPVRWARVVSVDDTLAAPWGARRYRVRFQEVEPPAVTAAPVATWGEAAALGWVWGSGLSWLEVAEAVARGETPDA